LQQVDFLEWKKQGLTKKELSESVDGYGVMLKKTYIPQRAQWKTD